jgi:hypothetical protein
MSKAQNCTSLVMRAGMQRIEVRDAVNAEDHRLTVEHEALLADLPSRLRKPSAGAMPPTGLSLEDLTGTSRRASST